MTIETYYYSDSWVLFELRRVLLLRNTQVIIDELNKKLLIIDKESISLAMLIDLDRICPNHY